MTLCEAAFAGVVASMSPEQMALLDPGLIETACRGMMTSAAIGWQAELERVRLISGVRCVLQPLRPAADAMRADRTVRSRSRHQHARRFGVPRMVRLDAIHLGIQCGKAAGRILSLGPECSRAAAGGAVGSNAFSRGSCAARERYSRGNDAGPASKRCAVALAWSFPGIPRLICGRSQNDSRMCQTAPSQAAEARCSSISMGSGPTRASGRFRGGQVRCRARIPDRHRSGRRSARPPHKRPDAGRNRPRSHRRNLVSGNVRFGQLPHCANRGDETGKPGAEHDNSLHS